MHFLCLILLLILLCISSSGTTISLKEWNALEKIYQSLHGTNWNYPAGDIPWDISNRSQDACQWSGLKCRFDFTTSNWTIVSISFRFSNFDGTLPEEIGSLSNLESINADNQNSKSKTGPGLRGRIPLSLFTIPSIKTIDLNWNYLFGPLPFLGKLTNLTQLSVSHNLLSGSIPHELGALTNLSKLDLSYNNFTGTIPQQLASLTDHIQYFSLFHNKLIGTIPSTFHSMPNLQTLLLGFNFFHGNFPIVNMPKIEVIDICYNSFAGMLPNLTLYPSLAYFNILHNQFVGSFPTDIQHMMNTLVYFNIAENQITGTLPSILSQFTQLQYFGVSRNYLYGSVPSFIASKSTLLFLLLFKNAFTGKIFETFTTSKILRTLDIGSNQFYGNIEMIPFAYPSLRTLRISSNQFTGTLSRNFTRLDRLSLFAVANNSFLTGNIEEIFDPHLQPALTVLDLSDNAFYGKIPKKLLTKTSKLRVISFAKNCVPIPIIPEEICSLSALQVLVLDGLLSGDSCRLLYFPSDQSLIRSYYLPSHPGHSLTIPQCLFSMPSLTTLYLSGNGLEGSLPEKNLTIGKNLVDLSLSSNILTGDIPILFQNHSWKRFDLSFNRFSGVIDQSLSLQIMNKNESKSIYTQAPSMTIHLQVNRLSGFIPKDLFDAKDISVLEGNIFDCIINPVNGKEELPMNDPKVSSYICGSQSVNNSLIAWTSFAFWIILFALIVIYFAIRSQKEPIRRRSTIARSPLNLSNQQIPKRISIIMATKVKVEGFFTTRLTLVLQHWQTMSIWLKSSLRTISSSNHSSTSSTQFRDNHFPGIQFFSEILVALQSQSLLVLFCIVVIFLPLYAFLSMFFHTHAYSYIWTVSIGYLSGKVTATVILIVLGVFYFFLFWQWTKLHEEMKEEILLNLNRHRKHDKDHDQEQEKQQEKEDDCLVPEANILQIDEEAKQGIATEKENELAKDIEDQQIDNQPKRFKPIPSTTIKTTTTTTCSSFSMELIHWMIYIFLYSLLILIDIVVVVGMNILYIFLLNRGVNKTQATFLQITIAILKQFWSFFYVKKLLIILQEKLLLLFPHEQQPQQHHHQQQPLPHSYPPIKAVQLSTWLQVFNYIFATMIATATFDSNCFQYFLFQSPTVTTSYITEIPGIQFSNSKITILPVPWPLTSEISYEPPFHYNFQCSSTLLSEFITVFIYKYILNIVMILGMVFLQELIYSFLQSKEEQETNNHSSPAVDDNTEEKGKESGEGIKRWLVNCPFLPMIMRFVLKRRFPLTSEKKVKKNEEEEEEDEVEEDEELNELKKSATFIFFDSDAFVINTVADLTVLLTFGIAFPLLSVVIVINLCLQTTFHRLCMGRLLEVLNPQVSQLEGGDQYKINRHRHRLHQRQQQQQRRLKPTKSSGKTSATSASIIPVANDELDHVGNEKEKEEEMDVLATTEDCPVLPSAMVVTADPEDPRDDEEDEEDNDDDEEEKEKKMKKKNQEYLKILNEECQLIPDYFGSHVLIFVLLFSSFFLSFFLFDILGDDVGVLSAYWILPVTICLPLFSIVLIWIFRAVWKRLLLLMMMKR